jgi:hypothetical protein
VAVSRRPLVTSAVAGGLLCALWFVPSANGAGPGEPAEAVEAPATTVVRTSAAVEDGSGPQLAETGSFDAAPYVVGGVGLLAAGAALVAHSVRQADAAGEPLA